MISAKFLCRNVLLGGKQQISVKKIDNFDSAFYMKSVSNNFLSDFVFDKKCEIDINNHISIII